jgi:hypothetical protein
MLLVLLTAASSPKNDPRDDRLGSGWNVLNGRYNQSHLTDGFTFEWQYFMVHDAKQQFTGSLGFVLVDPKGRLGRVSEGSPFGDNGMRLPISAMPSGASVAIGGRWGDGSTFANYERLTSDYKVGQDTKDFVGFDRTKGYFAELSEVAKVTAEGGEFRARGRTADVSWDLSITPDWTERASDKVGEPFGPLHGTDVGRLPGERWSVHMQWPRTLVHGEMRDLKTGKVYAVEGHGYRENAWGRFNFAFDGWAFGIVSDPASRVQWAWQSYHKSKDMDWLDLSFEDNGQLVKRRFFAKDKALRWTLKNWSFDPGARQCVPNAVEVVAQDGDYRVKASYDLSQNQLPMLSNATPLTKIFVIMVHTPIIKGTIERAATGELVTAFSGQGGGEFSTTRSIWRHVDTQDCEHWGWRFNAEYPTVSPAP